MDRPQSKSDRAEAAYHAGDYRTARRIARALAADAETSEAERRRARQILAATGIDPVALGAFALTAGLLVYLLFRYVF